MGAAKALYIYIFISLYASETEVIVDITPDIVKTTSTGWRLDTPKQDYDEK